MCNKIIYLREFYGLPLLSKCDLCESAIAKTYNRIFESGGLEHLSWMHIWSVVLPEIGCRGPFESEACQVHGSINQQKENGHNTGNGVELPRKQHQLQQINNGRGRERKRTKNNNGWIEIPLSQKQNCICKLFFSQTWTSPYFQLLKDVMVNHEISHWHWMHPPKKVKHIWTAFCAGIECKAILWKAEHNTKLIVTSTFVQYYAETTHSKWLLRMSPLSSVQAQKGFPKTSKGPPESRK